ncbi:hypothetical protein KAR91_83980 [Candidatus Pacearchaeota archaeon]|nr:hypothetical protein [Candidatus Pacearchaeota archaeon]
MGQARDLTGEKFGRLIVIGLNRVNKYHQRFWECRCNCGTTKIINGSRLKKGETKSCGCLHRDIVTTHGMEKTATYRIWRNMLYRCRTATSKDYKNYGGRGIAVCERWFTFENFLKDMGERPENMSIERLENNKDYSPENCKWATTKEQNRNHRGNRKITYKGETKILIEWAEHLGIKYGTLQCRLHRGWSIDKTLSTKIERRY